MLFHDRGAYQGVGGPLIFGTLTMLAARRRNNRVKLKLVEPSLFNELCGDVVIGVIVGERADRRQ